MILTRHTTCLARRGGRPAWLWRPAAKLTAIGGDPVSEGTWIPACSTYLEALTVRKCRGRIIARDVALGLAYLAASGIMHLDIK